MKNRIVTISREFGSGGRTVGKKLAQKLQIPCYDQEIIEKIAAESGFAEDYIRDRSEYSPHTSWIANAHPAGNELIILTAKIQHNHGLMGHTLDLRSFRIMTLSNSARRLGCWRADFFKSR